MPQADRSVRTVFATALVCGAFAGPASLGADAPDRRDAGAPSLVEVWSIESLGAASPPALGDLRVAVPSVPPVQPRGTGANARIESAPYAEPVSRVARVSATTKLSGVLAPGGDVIAATFSPDGTRVVFTADADTHGTVELYSVPSDGSMARTKISRPLTPGGGTGRFVITPDGARVVYSSTVAPGGLVELHSVPIGGPAAASIKLNGVTGTVGAFGLVPDGSSVAYTADQDAVGVVELYSVPTDGSAAPIKLNSALGAGGNVVSAVFCPNSLCLAYRADATGDERFDVFGAPIDGGAAATKLNSALDAGQNTALYQVAPDSDTVIYTASQPTPGLFDVFSVDIDGPTGSGVDLSRAAAPNVFQIEVAQDGTVVYRGFQNTPGVADVYSAPSDGSSPPIKISGVMPVAGDAFNVDLEPGNGLAAYTADQITDGVTELFGAPIDGGAPPWRLHALPGTHDVGAFGSLGTPIVSGRVLYPVFSSGLANLFSVPVDGSQPPVQLNPALPPGTSVSSAFVPPDGATILAYGAEQETVGVVEAFVVPLNGSLPAVKINASMVEGGDVASSGVDSTETRAIYIADQEVADTFELYAALIDVDGDGVPDATDNCPRAPNAGQGPVPFGQTVRASDATTFGWDLPTDVQFVRGPLSLVSTYAFDVFDSRFDVVSVFDDDLPLPGAGFYYVFRLGADCSVASWQTAIGAEPGRDVVLP